MDTRIWSKEKCNARAGDAVMSNGYIQFSKPWAQMRWSKEHSDKEKGAQHRNLRIPVFKNWVEKGPARAWPELSQKAPHFQPRLTKICRVWLPTPPLFSYHSSYCTLALLVVFSFLPQGLTPALKHSPYSLPFSRLDLLRAPPKKRQVLNVAFPHHPIWSGHPFPLAIIIIIEDVSSLWTFVFLSISHYWELHEN